MKKIYVLMALVFITITSVSCTAESISKNPPNQYATSDTGGQKGHLNPPPPPVAPINP